MNHYFTSDGQRLTEGQIAYKLTASYQRTMGEGICEGCGGYATCHAHIIPKARCKQLRKAELIWDEKNFFPSCHRCNLAIENPKGSGWKTLKNISYCLNFIKQHDSILYNKFITQ